MQKNVKTRQSSLLRNSITILLLPIIIFIWTTGWTLTQIGEPGKSTESSQKALRTHPRFESLEKESEIPNEDSTITNEPQIVA
jgi:hypothetical protein